MIARAYIGCWLALLAYAVGVRFGLGWGFLVGAGELVALAVIESANDAARRLRGRDVK